jgi:hypothetical protein
MSTVFYPGQTDYIAQLNALWDRVTAQVTGTSTSSVTVGTGSKSLTIETNKQFASTGYVRVARTSDPTIYMTGTVTSYNAGTGAMVVSVDTAAGAGTFTDWTVTLAGATGATGPAATIAVGTVTTLAAGSAATVSNSGTSGAAVFDFGLPQGATGPSGTVAVGTTTTGAAGSSASVTNSGTSTAAVLDFTIPRGDTGTAATVAVGTVTTGAPGTSATITNTGTSSAAVFNFTIPKGDTGSAGVASGSDTQVQFNDGGLFAGATGLTWNKTTGQVSLGNNLANYLKVVGQTAGGAPGISSDGSDTNVGFNYSTKGTGTHTFSTNGFAQTQIQIPHVASAVNYHAIYGAATGASPTIESRGSDANIGLNLTSKGTGTIGLFTNGGVSPVRQAAVVHIANAVNYVNLQGAITGAGPGITAGGADANIALTYTTKGTGVHAFYTNGGTKQFQLNHVASAVNYIAGQGAVTSGTPQIGSAGNDSDVHLNLVTKGRGAIGMNTGAPASKLHVGGDAVGGNIATAASVDTTTDIVTTVAAHNFITGDAAVVVYSGGTAYGGLPAMTLVYVNVLSATTLTLHSTLVDAINGTAKRDITSAGTGTMQLQSASRVASFRMLTNNDTNIDLFAYRNSVTAVDWTTASTRIQHRVDVSPQGYIEFNSSSTNQGGVQIGSQGSGAFINFYLTDGEQVRITRTNAAVNYLNLTGAATGGSPTLSAAGTDPNISLTLSGKGTGTVIATGGLTVANNTNLWLGASGAVDFSGRGQLTFSGVSTANIKGNGGALLTRLQFGSTGTGGPSLVFSGTTIKVRLGDDSADAPLTAGAFTASGTLIAGNSLANYASINGAATGANVSYSVAGSDTDIGISVTGKGSGSITLRNGNGPLFVAQGTSASLVNYFQASANSAGNSPVIQTNGTDTNIDWRARPKGSGSFFFETNVFGNTQLKITDTASAVNYAQITGGVTGTGASISVVGTDTNADLNLSSKGTGLVKANGSPVRTNANFVAGTDYATPASVAAKQDALVSGTSIKTINGASLLGGGDIVLVTRSGVETLSNKTLQAMSTASVDKGNSGTTAQTIDYSAGSHQKITATGNFTLNAPTNWPASGLAAILLEAVNFGSFTVTMPTINWVKPDGSTTTSFSTWLAANSGRTTLQSSGTDWLRVWTRDGGTTLYGSFAA